MAEAIRDTCWGVGLGAVLVTVPTIGRAWVHPNGYVDLQFGAVVGTPSFEGRAKGGELGGSKIRLLLADGGNRTSMASTSVVDSNACHMVSLVSLENI